MQRFIIVKMSVFPRLFYQVNAIPIKMPIMCLLELIKLILIVISKRKCVEILKILKKKNCEGKRVALSDRKS